MMYRVGKQRNRGNRTTKVREQTRMWVRSSSVVKDDGYGERRGRKLGTLARVCKVTAIERRLAPIRSESKYFDQAVYEETPVHL